MLKPNEITFISTTGALKRLLADMPDDIPLGSGDTFTEGLNVELTETLSKTYLLEFSGETTDDEDDEDFEDEDDEDEDYDFFEDDEDEDYEDE